MNRLTQLRRSDSNCSATVKKNSDLTSEDYLSSDLMILVFVQLFTDRTVCQSVYV